jgi:hypothetical protein
MPAIRTAQSAPELRRDRFPFSALVWLGMVVYLALAKVVLDGFLPHAFASDDQRDLFAWPVIGAIGSVGLVGVWLAHRTGFPAAWGEGATIRRRLLVPAAGELALGAWYVASRSPAGTRCRRPSMRSRRTRKKVQAAGEDVSVAG